MGGKEEKKESRCPGAKGRDFFKKRAVSNPPACKLQQQRGVRLSEEFYLYT